MFNVDPLSVVRLDSILFCQTCLRVVLIGKYQEEEVSKFILKILKAFFVFVIFGVVVRFFKTKIEKKVFF